MFTHTCTACARRQLVFTSQITSMTNTEAGIVVLFDCWCGAEQTWVTGKSARTTRRTPVAA